MTHAVASNAGLDGYGVAMVHDVFHHADREARGEPQERNGCVFCVVKDLDAGDAAALVIHRAASSSRVREIKSQRVD